MLNDNRLVQLSFDHFSPSEDYSTSLKGRVAGYSYPSRNGERRRGFHSDSRDKKSQHPHPTRQCACLTRLSRSRTARCPSTPFRTKRSSLYSRKQSWTRRGFWSRNVRNPSYYLVSHRAKHAPSFDGGISADVSKVYAAHRPSRAIV